jgi:hypothetical protein
VTPAVAKKGRAWGFCGHRAQPPAAAAKQTVPVKRTIQKTPHGKKGGSSLTLKTPDDIKKYTIKSDDSREAYLIEKVDGPLTRAKKAFGFGKSKK